MDISTLKQRIQSMGVSDDVVSYGKEHRFDSYCVSFNGKQWEVFYSENGEKSGLKLFESERDACNFFLMELSENRSFFQDYGENILKDPRIIPYGLIENKLKCGEEVSILFSNEKSYNEAILRTLNRLCANNNDKLRIQFNIHPFNCNVLRILNQVKNLYILPDYKMPLSNLESLKELKNIQKLELFLSNYDPNFLNYENLRQISKLTLLGLGAEQINIKYLANYQNLKSLTIGDFGEQNKYIGEILNLETLVIETKKFVSMGFLNEMKNLKELKLVFTKRNNFNDIQDNIIEKLDLFYVKIYETLKGLEKFKSLKSLSISMSNMLTELYLPIELSELEELKIESCRKLKKIIGLKKLKKLREIEINGTAIPFKRFMRYEKPRSLETISFSAGDSKKDAKYAQIILSKGYKLKNHI